MELAVSHNPLTKMHQHTRKSPQRWGKTLQKSTKHIWRSAAITEFRGKWAQKDILWTIFFVCATDKDFSTQFSGVN